MPLTTDAYDLRGRTLVDRVGDRIGRIDELYDDAEGDQPAWALVSTGRFGTERTFVPIGSASPAGEDLQVPIGRGAINDAPRIDTDQELSEPEERRLFDHYQIAYAGERGPTAGGPLRLRKHVVTAPRGS